MFHESSVVVEVVFTGGRGGEEAEVVEFGEAVVDALTLSGAESGLELVAHFLDAGFILVELHS